ncbi:MAG: endonuclease/exonuclease/phosphatase family protein [Pseudomonadota bacterium]
MIAVLAGAVHADSLRIATYNTELFRKGPGLLLRDILRGEDAQVSAVIAEIVAVEPDVITLQGIDYDLENRALSALAAALEDAGRAYPHQFSGPPNSGRVTQVDLDGDGKTGGPADAQGYGRFLGQGSMAVLSRFPIDHDKITDFSKLLWQEMPGAMLPKDDKGPFPSPAAINVQRLSSHGHWVIPIRHPTLGQINVMTYHATPPVFDGPEDRNGRRNHDETRFWSLYLNGAFGPAPKDRFVIAGDANLDPEGGDGLGAAMATLLAHKSVQDPLPGLPTVVWEQTGPLRVDYVLPSTDWRVVDAAVRPINPEASRHALVWVELAR